MKHDHETDEKPALSYPVNVRTLPVKGVVVQLEANETECHLLAQRHNLQSVTSFNAELHIFPWKKRGVKIKGHLQTDIIQECVVTLEALPDKIRETLEVVMVPEGSKLAKPKTHEETGEIFIDVDGPDIPEVYQGDIIDVGALVEEFFELSINPYPRKAGAEFAALDVESKENEDKIYPFEILKKLKDN